MIFVIVCLRILRVADLDQRLCSRILFLRISVFRDRFNLYKGVEDGATSEARALPLLSLLHIENNNETVNSVVLWNVCSRLAIEHDCHKDSVLHGQMSTKVEFINQSITPDLY